MNISLLKYDSGQCFKGLFFLSSVVNVENKNAVPYLSESKDFVFITIASAAQ